MKKLLVACWMLVAPVAMAVQTPTERVEAGVADIIRVATNSEQTTAQKRAELESIIQQHVDLQAAAQRVIAQHWKRASKEDKKAFLVLFRKVLVNTYINLLNQYDNQEISFKGEQIKKQKYATVDTEINNKGVVTPVSYRLFFRNDDWRIYDFVAEGISMIRSFSNDYKATLKKEGLAGLNKALEAKLKEVE